VTRNSAGRRPILWWALTIIAGVGFFLLALSDIVYEVTSPPGPLQILLRKSYSIAAFAILGYLPSRALWASEKTKTPLYVAAAIAAYSLVIEVSQAILGAQEGLVWNAVDVAFGFVGGYLGAVVRERLAKARTP
jgi:glycopeptide antibiotics resistance protein